MVDLNFCRLFY